MEFRLFIKLLLTLLLIFVDHLPFVTHSTIRMADRRPAVRYPSLKILKSPPVLCITAF